MSECKIAPFTGIKFSKKTEIFYKFIKGELHKMPVYSGSENKGIWVKSDYVDDSGNSRNWKKATKEQIEKFDLNNTKKR